ncbi:hypothetical protein EZZ81_08535 [Pseudomonas viridiflava]|uniref:Uncharacterized protein n=1 Tax=Pseudomonas viridiflava TaxID=33069 RepID=A0AA46ZVH2_PSEVI|nr:hypothetical protein EZZ81_08535 [Pseudomonas viridiflava]
MGADLSANAVFQPPHMRRMYWPFRGQVRSHKIQFLQWFTGCLIRGGLPAMNDDAIFLTYRVNCIAGKPPPTVRSLLRDSAVSATCTVFQRCASITPPADTAPPMTSTPSRPARSPDR